MATTTHPRTTEPGLGPRDVRGRLAAVVVAVAVAAGAGGYAVGASGDSSATRPDPTPSSTAAASLGSPDAPVTMVEYADFRCPFCARHATEVHPELVRRYVDTGILRIEWHDFPAQGGVSTQLAIAARAAADQDGFWAFHDAVFASQPRDADPATLRQLATQAGLDVDRFQRDVARGGYALAVRQDHEQGLRAGIRGTPAFAVNGRTIPGAQPLDVFVSAIEQAVEDAATVAGGGERTRPPRGEVTPVTPEQAATLLAAPPPDLLVLDVRTPEEFAAGHLPGAVNLDFHAADFSQQLARLDPDRPTLVYCRSGNRSGQAVQLLADLGFTTVYDVQGGLEAWAASGQTAA